MRPLGLTTKFLIYSFLIILIVGIIAGYLLTGLIRQQIFSDFVSNTIAVQRSIFADRVFKPDFQPGSKRLSGTKFNRFIKDRVLSRDIILVKIWRRDGTVLYSTERQLIGRRFTPDENLRRALSGKISVEESSLSKKENIFERPKFGRLIEIYTPIKFNGRVVGAFETYFSLDPVDNAVSRIRLLVTLLLGGGLGILWLTLTGIARGASATIDRQTGELRQLSNNLARSLEELQESYLGTMRSLATAVEARDPYTTGHVDRTGKICTAICRILNLSEDQIIRTQRAAELHDIGKIGVPESILAKPRKLTPGEWKRMKRHADVGATIVAAAPFLRDVAPIVRHHHEHFDGEGYPDGLFGDQIPIESRILAVVDAFDAMTTDRPYRQALPLEETLNRLEKAKGTKFDPKVVDAFIMLVREKPDLLKGEKTAA